MEAAQNDLKLPEGVAPILGDYRLVRFINESAHMVMYHAIQESVDRSVVLQILKPDACADDNLRSEFKKLARAKAGLVHPNVAPVYELLRAGPILFYTGELLTGRNLDQLASAGKEVNIEQLLEIMCIISEAMVTIKGQGIAHRPIKGTDIYLDDENQAHLANLALPAGAPNASQNEGVGLRKFILSLQAIAPKGQAADLLAEMRKLSDEKTLTWQGLLEQAKQARANYQIGKANYSLGAKSLATAFLQRKHRKRRIAITALILCGILFLLSFFFALPEKVTIPPVANPLINVPAGTVTINGEESFVDSFWIDKYEVTIAQYDKFLQAVEVTGSRNYQHQHQPKEKTSHKPAGWDEMLSAAQAGEPYNGQPLTINHPVTLVDWWDAYAYAKWKGRRLPTAAEWRKASAGPKNLRFPWGASPPAGRANLGADYNTNETGGSIDGFILTAPVNFHGEDVSPHGVYGMAGNVEEWTSTLVTHAQFPDRMTPAVCGGSFGSPKGLNLQQSQRADSESEVSPARGFRTASSNEPGAGG